MHAVDGRDLRQDLLEVFDAVRRAGFVEPGKDERLLGGWWKGFRGLW